jgi:hypothetical protein
MFNVHWQPLQSWSGFFYCFSSRHLVLKIPIQLPYCPVRSGTLPVLSVSTIGKVFCLYNAGLINQKKEEIKNVRNMEQKRT